MRKLTTILVTLTVGVFVHAARAAEKVDPDKVVGKWVWGTGDYADNVTFNKDGTYSVVSHRGPGDSRTESGTYKLEGNVLTMKCDKCSVESMAGKEHAVNVTKATGDALTLIEGDDKTSEIELTKEKG